MKRLNQLLILLAFVTSMIACKKEQPEEQLSPVILLGQTEITLDADGAAVSIGYMIDNPVDGEKISVSSDAEWLNFSTAKVRAIEFTATPNGTGQERTAEVTVSYKDAEPVTITVSQLCFESPITLTVSDVSATGITFSVITSDPELTWMPMVSFKEYFDSYASDDELFEGDLEYYRYLADIYEVSLQEFLTEMVATGTQENIFYGQLDPLTEYTLYVYGISLDGRRTTEIVSHSFKTDAPYEGDITFTFEAAENDFILEFSVIPSETGVNYYHGIATEAEIEAWKEQYDTDDLRTAIQKGDIDASVQSYIDWGFIEGPEDYFFMYNESDVVDWGYQEVKASTKYVIFAAKWNEECQLVGEVSTYEHTTSSVDASDNQLTMTLSNITQSSVDVSVTTTNDDPYAMLPVKSSEIEGMSDEEIFAYVTDVYDYLIGEYTYVGDKTKTFSMMRPESEYTALAFGFKGGVQTTEMLKQNFTTIASGDPKECTFEFKVEPDTDNVWVEITPSDKGHFYHWMVYPASYTVDDAKSYIQMLIEYEYENDFSVFASWNLSQGYESMTVWDLYPDTEYKVGAVVMDYETGEYLNELVFSEVFRTKEVTYADITFDVTLGKYFDVRELIAAGNKQFESLLQEGVDAILNVSVKPVGECSEFYYDIYPNDLMDAVVYPDIMFYEGLYYGVNTENAKFKITYDTPNTLVALGYDNDKEVSLMHRQLFTLTKEGASPAEEWSNSASKAASSFTPEVKSARIDRKQSTDARLFGNEAVAAKTAAKAKIESSRKETARKQFDLVKERKSERLTGRHIAR